MTLQGWPPSGRSTRTNEQAKIPDELGRRQPRKLCWAVPRLCWAPDPRTGKGQRQASRWLPAVSAAWGSSRGGRVTWHLGKRGSRVSSVAWLRGPDSVSSWVPTMARGNPASRVYGEPPRSLPAVLLSRTWCRVRAFFGAWCGAGGPVSTNLSGG